MFPHFPFDFTSSVRQTILVLNTVLLIGALIIVELVYSEAPKEKRQELRYFFPLFLVLVGLLIYAVWFQRKGL